MYLCIWLVLLKVCVILWECREWDTSKNMSYFARRAGTEPLHTPYILSCLWLNYSSSQSMGYSYIRQTRDATSDTRAYRAAPLLSRTECSSGCRSNQFPRDLRSCVPWYIYERLRNLFYRISKEEPVRCLNPLGSIYTMRDLWALH